MVCGLSCAVPRFPGPPSLGIRCFLSRTDVARSCYAIRRPSKLFATVTSRDTTLVVMNLKQLYDAVDRHHLLGRRKRPVYVVTGRSLMYRRCWRATKRASRLCAPSRCVLRLEHVLECRLAEQSFKVSIERIDIAGASHGPRPLAVTVPAPSPGESDDPRNCAPTLPV